MKQIADAEVLPATFADQLPLVEDFIMAGMPIPVNRRGSSFTALLELPPIQAVELLHAAAGLPANLPTGHQDPHSHPRPYPMLIMNRAPAYPTNAALPENYPILATGGCGKDSPVSSSKVKCDEPADTGSNPNLMTKVSDSMAASPPNEKPPKRKVGEKKGKGSSCKKSRTTESEDDVGENLLYVHVRARRGQATNRHSLAERARRNKINARMKLLQELIPGCNKISGTALVLDEIIDHVQSLQRQVEYLSMKLAAAYPRVDFNLESFLATNGSLMESSSYTSMVMPSRSQTWPDFRMKDDKSQCQQQWQLEALTRPVWNREEENRNLVASESSLLSYDSSANSATLHSNKLKIEL